MTSDAQTLKALSDSQMMLILIHNERWIPADKQEFLAARIELNNAALKSAGKAA